MTTSGQARLLARRPKVFAMYWRLTVIVVIAFSILIFVSFAMFKLLYPHGITAQQLFHDAAIVIALPLSMAGSNKLKRAGFGKFPMRYILCSGIFSFATMFLLFLPLPKSIRHVVLECGYYSFYVLIAGMLPLSFYLSHKQKESSTETTVADAR
jgi:hypothetical protein